MAVKITKESSPLWVWLAIALLVLGAITYATGVAVMEFFMTFF